MLTPDEFRQALSRFASGVTVVTTLDSAGRPAGLTASAFTAVSLTPPLVLVCVAHSAHSYPALRDSDCFAVNILAQDQEAVSQRFASSRSTSAEKFEAVTHAPGSLGLPLIHGGLAALECRTVHAYPGGDHTIFVGRVESARCDGEPAPLLYYLGRYRRLAPQGAPS